MAKFGPFYCCVKNDNNVAEEKRVLHDHGTESIGASDWALEPC